MISTHIRDIKLGRLVNFVVFIARQGESHYEELRRKVAEKQILSHGEEKKLAKGTFYRYLLASLEFNLIERVSGGTYTVTDTGVNLAITSQNSGEESEAVKDILRNGFLGSGSVKEAFISLFTCQKTKPLLEGRPIAYVPSYQSGHKYQLYLSCSDSSLYLGDSQTKAIIWGLRPLAVELGLIDELIVPRTTVVAPDRRIMLYPTSPKSRRMAPQEIQLSVVNVLHKIVRSDASKRANETCLIAVSDILYLLCPLLQHPVKLVREELSDWVCFNEEWLRAEKVAGFVREFSYVERGMQRRFGKATENMFIKVRGYNISHLAFQAQALLSKLESPEEV